MDRREEELRIEVARCRREVALRAETLGRTLAEGLSPLQALKRASVATALASIAAGFAIGTIAGPERRRGSGDGDRASHGALGGITREIVLALLPALVPALLTMLVKPNPKD